MNPSSSLTTLIKSNQVWVEWFNQQHRPDLQQIQKLSPYSIELTGSRSVDLAYPQSDLEYAVVVPETFHETFNETSDEHKEILLKAVYQYYAQSQFAQPDQMVLMKTNEDSYLLVAKFTTVGMWKVKMTIRTQNEHDQIQNNMRTQLATWSSEDKLKYILSMQQAFLQNDEATMAQMKAWMKVL